MNIQTLLVRATSWVQAELSAQNQLLDVLSSMERAVRENQTERLLDAGATLERVLGQNPARDRLRTSVMEGFAAHFGVPASTLSLSSILARAEDEGASCAALASLRIELRVRVQKVAKEARLLSAIAGHHRGVLAELMEILGTSSNSDDARRAGVLVDAEA